MSIEELEAWKGGGLISISGFFEGGGGGLRTGIFLVIFCFFITCLSFSLNVRVFESGASYHRIYLYLAAPPTHPPTTTLPSVLLLVYSIFHFQF